MLWLVVIVLLLLAKFQSKHFYIAFKASLKSLFLVLKDIFSCLWLAYQESTSKLQILFTFSLVKMTLEDLYSTMTNLVDLLFNLYLLRFQ